jgi:hypothetical protein
VEGREIAIGADGSGEDAMDGFEERELLHVWRAAAGVSRDARDEALGVLLCSFKNEGGGSGVGEDSVHVGLLLCAAGRTSFQVPPLALGVG